MGMADKGIEVNAVITSADVTLDRDCFLSCWLMLDYGGSGQGFGGYVLGGVSDTKAGRHEEQKNIAAIWLVGVLEAAGVTKLSDCVGKVVRVRKVSDFGDILAIGHAIKNDKWFEPRKAFAFMKQEAA